MVFLKNKIVLSINNRQSILDFIKREKPKKIFLGNNLLKCKSYINKVDVIIIDNCIEKIDQYILLRKVAQLIFKCDLKPDLGLIMVQSGNISENEKINVYRQLIQDFLEALAKLKGLDKQSDIKEGREYLKIFTGSSLMI